MYKAFLEEIKITRSDNTYELYSNALKRFPNGTRDEILELIADSRLQSTTKKTYLVILGSALDFYDRKTKDIERLINGYRTNKTVEPCPTQDEVEKIWKKLTTPRDQLVFALMAYNGLRISEVFNLEVDDVLPNDRLLLRDTKGKEDCIVPIVHSRTKKALAEYLVKRKCAQRKLILSRGNKPITLDALKVFITRKCRSCGLPYHPHSFRRYFGNTLSRAGVPVQQICVAMRHKNIATTMRYLNINQDDTRNVLEMVFKED